MKQKLLIVLLILALVVSIGLPVQASSNEPTVVINGELQSYSQPPLIIKGSTLVPLRGIFESLGATVDWNGETKTVTATSGNTKISLKIGSVDTVVNGKNVKISVPAQIINNSTMVPLRFVSEALGASVGWDGKTRTITIQYSTKVEEKDIGSEIANEEQEFFYKETRDGIKTKTTKDEFDSLIDTSLKYLEDENHINLPLPKELEVLKKYEYTRLIRGADGIYNVFVIGIGEGLESEIGSKIPYIGYMNGTGTVYDGRLNLDTTYYFYPILTDKVDTGVHYEVSTDYSIPLNQFEGILSEDILAYEKNKDAINFEDKELEKMIKHALGKNSSEKIREEDISNITEIEILGPYIRILKKNGLDITELGDFSFCSSVSMNSYTIDGKFLSDAGNISSIKDLVNFSGLKLLIIRVQPKLEDINYPLNFDKIVNLDLSSNSIEDISSLANLKNLTRLYLSYNKIRDISALSELRNLETLYLRKNEIGDISALSKLTDLETLYISNNKIRDISALLELRNLEALDLSSNEIRDISALSELRNLETLDLSSNQISDVSMLSELKNLIELRLVLIEISNVSFLSDLTDLETLILISNKISDISSLSELKNLETLDLTSNEISDINALSKLNNLNSLTILSNPIKDYSPIKSLSNLEKLELDGDYDYDDFDLIK